MLLSRSQAREARAALRALSKRFLAQRPAAVADPTLATGHAGVALAHAALDTACPGAGHAAAMQRALGRAIEALATVPLSPSLYGGFTGVAWVADLLSGDSTAALDDDPNAAVDAALESYLNAERASRDPYDLVDGLVGIGVYALERTARPSGRRVLAWVVRRLAEAARRYPPGVAWPTDPRWVPREVRRTRDPAWDRRSHDERGSRAGSRAAHLLMGSADASIATRAAASL